MFAETAEHRVVVTLSLDDGTKRDLPPTRLARRAGATAGIYLAGSERYVPGPVHRTPREHLGAIADLACVEARDSKLGPTSARVELFERDDAASPEVRFVAERTCGGR
jgi:hypothetical protein